MFSNFAASYATTTQLVVSLIAFLLVYGIYRILAFVYNELTSPIRHVPGPPNPSLIYGSFKKLTESVSRKLTLSCSDCSTDTSRTIPSCRRIGSINTDRQSNIKRYSE